MLHFDTFCYVVLPSVTLSYVLLRFVTFCYLIRSVTVGNVQLPSDTFSYVPLHYVPFRSVTFC
jgi:hypothetical protein